MTGKRASARITIAILMVFLAVGWLTAESTKAPGAAPIAESRAYAIATQALIAYFKDDLMKSTAFQDTFGAVTWRDISQSVIDSIDITRDREEEKKSYADKSFLFTGSIFDMYTEIAVDKATGTAKVICVKMDSY
jgi:hypothetical protein